LDLIDRAEKLKCFPGSRHESHLSAGHLIKRLEYSVLLLASEPTPVILKLNNVTAL